MVSVDEYKPSNEFEKDDKGPLLEIPLSDSKELWLIQWPDKQVPDFDERIPINLHHDGQLATFENESGSYSMVSYASQEPDATVFLSSASEAKIAGKIARRVCLVRYPELKELEQNAKKKAEASREARQSSKNTGITNTTATPAKSSRAQRGSLPAVSGMSRGNLGGPSLGSSQKSKLSDSGKPKKRRANEPTRTVSKAVNFSDGPVSGVTTTSLGSAGSSRSENSKKRKKEVNEEE